MDGSGGGGVCSCALVFAVVLMVVFARVGVRCVDADGNGGGVCCCVLVLVLVLMVEAA